MQHEFNEQDLIDIEELFKSDGYKIYKKILLDELKLADNNVHSSEKHENYRFWQGYYKAIERILRIEHLLPERIMDFIEERGGEKTLDI